ncbi:LCP family protein [Streptomyces sp. VRA16 Mangrove soil]|uniref:LCP family protein n=1 Tax=Streptomyces sp. VRA16 Mangrove soil TaxID=2817434 RepID=UPI001A9E9415|nr:LCP family protein [Streptomyces sp. VRA16 Mangrove soil]MBO1333929.1 LCP family protein [Streptomyces sp. VRA16 Mangrove soil]
MNDRYDGYDQQNYELVGYDEFGQPVYRQVRQAPSYDQSSGYGYGYDPYATGQQQPVQQPAQPQGYDPYGGAQQGSSGGYDPYGAAAGTGQQQRVAPHPEQQAQATAYIPQQAPPAAEESGAGSAPRDHRTEQFDFVEEPDENSEDVIDWLKFTESRTERREEARRRGRNRVVALVVVLALCLAGGVGYLWYAGKLPFLSDDSKKSTAADAVGPQNRDVIVVHLHNTKGGATSTALLVNNTTTKQGTTVLLPNALSLTDDEGSATTLAKSVADDGSSGTSDAIDTLLGTDIEGTWRLDTPFLSNLVELVGNVEVDTDTDVPDPDKKGTTLVHKGQDQTLSGAMAVAYATYRAKGEAQTAQLMRFGQVMQGVLRKISSDPQAATTTVQTLTQIIEPPLTEKDLGAFLAKLADHAKQGDYKTAVLPVQRDGSVSRSTADSVVKDVLGGTVKAPSSGDSPRVSVQNATGDTKHTDDARVTLVNGGYTFVSGGTGTTVATSRVTYADAGSKDDAVEVAKTLNLPTSAVKKGETTANADVSVVLGQDYTGK